MEGIKSLTEFVYGNVYAIHINNVEEIYPLAVLFEFHLLQKVAEYIHPEVAKLDWTNKIIPVSPNLFSKRPTGKISQANKQGEENNSATPDSSENQSSEEEAAPQPNAKGKRPATKSPIPKEPQTKRAKKSDEDEKSRTEKVEDDVKKTKRDSDDDVKKSEKKSPTNRTRRDSGDEEKKPIITQELKVQLKRVDDEIRGDLAKKAPAKPTPPEKNKNPSSKVDGVKDGRDQKEAMVNGTESPKEKEPKMTTPSRKEKATPKGDASLAKQTAKKSKAPDETVFECGKCKVIFTSLEKCNEHMTNAHNVSMVSVNENFICSKADCGFKCDDAETLKDHVLVEHPDSLAKKHKCGICDAEFESIEALETHVEVDHTKRVKEKRYVSVNNMLGQFFVGFGVAHTCSTYTW